MSPRTYFITGSSRGIGLELVKQLAAKGNIVIASARNPDSAEQLQQLVDNKKVFAVKLDVQSEDSVKAAVAKVNEISPDGIDVLINNSGIIAPKGSISTTTDPEVWGEIYQTNVVGVVRVTQQFLPVLRKKDTRQIIQISSDSASLELANRPNLNAPYHCSKAALNMFSRCLSHDLADEKFTCVCIHPGWVITDMGGSNADLTTEVSVSSMVKVFEKYTQKDNGWYGNWKGERMPW
ncbi:hypothetical protein BC943DRAFT_288674 [Umbelopsis sp. AD052]|nr:hypothetical protein BC943DRAFT_288674 [Umbelopsis sp. AD052]